MMNLVISALVSVLVSTFLLVAGSALIEAMRRRGFDPIDRIANLLSPVDMTAQMNGQ